MARIGVIGAGSWGSALAILLTNNGHEVIVWSHREEEARLINETKRHASKLPGVVIPDALIYSSDLKATMSDKDVLILAVPSLHVRSTCRKMKPYIRAGQIIVNVAKGIEEDTLYTMSMIIEEELPFVDACILSGPSHAEEVSRGLPTTCVVSSNYKKTALYLQNIFSSPVFRVYTSSDMLGVELGGALKNVIALAAGASDGIGYGDNLKAALITRGMGEITKLGIVMGGNPETFYGLTGVGDLIVTCASIHSRNRKAGFLMGQGLSMEEAMNEVKMVVEGVYSAKAALALSRKYKVEMPIVEQVNKVLFENKSAKEAVMDLMIRDRKQESDSLEW